MLNVPKLRFKEFSGEWEERKLGDIATRSTLKNKDNKINFVLTNSATKGIVSQQNYFDKDIANKNNLEGYYVVKLDDFVYNPRISIQAPVGPIKRNKLLLGIMSPLYTVFKIKDENLSFIEYFFTTTIWHRYMNSIANFGARHDRMNITNVDFLKMLICLPQKQEQQKIATFLTAIDKKIEQLTEKEKHLQAYKKGVMQKIFSQEIRFRDDNGGEFGDWVERRLGEVGKVSMCKRILKKDTTLLGDIPFYKIGTFGKNADAYISSELYENYKNKYSFPKKGDILISASGTIGRTVVYDGLPSYFQDSNIVWINNNEELVKNSFLYFFYKTVRWTTEDTTIARLYNENLRNIIILSPSKKEQTKIANFLSSIDQKIEQVTKQIEESKKFKKGLLQQMFV